MEDKESLFQDRQEKFNSLQRIIEYDEEITELRDDQDLGLWSQKMNDKKRRMYERGTEEKR